MPILPLRRYVTLMLHVTFTACSAPYLFSFATLPRRAAATMAAIDYLPPRQAAYTDITLPPPDCRALFAADATPRRAMPTSRC